MFGGDYDTPDGTAIRDFIHVVDLAEAHVTALERILQGKQKEAFEFFNIGTGLGYSVLEAIAAFEKSTGQKLNYEVVDRRPGDIEQIYADTTVAANELGWRSTRGLEDMMSSAWKWEQHISSLI